MIYDKTYQVREGNLVVDYEGLAKEVLRFEVHCEREYIRKVVKKSGKSNTLDLSWQMIEESEDRIIDHFIRCFADIRFVQMENLKEQIKKSSSRKEIKSLCWNWFRCSSEFNLLTKRCKR